MHIDMKITAKRDEVLVSLRANREEHQQIVKEARVGYVAKAKEAIRQRLAELESGKLAALQFGLAMPTDYTKDYDAAIRMLELHQAETVELDDSMVRCLVLNEWGWMDAFLGSNVSYSRMAAQLLDSR
jgi:hypothetical protein